MTSRHNLSPNSSLTTIVYFDHTAKLGGGEISLLNLVRHLDTARYLPVVVLGQDGDLAVQLREAGIETYILPLDAQIAQTRKDTLDGSLALRVKQGLRALSYVARLAWFLHRRGAQILHTNSLKPMFWAVWPDVWPAFPPCGTFATASPTIICRRSPRACFVWLAASCRNI